MDTLFRQHLSEKDKFGLAPYAEGCALFSALVSLVFCFLLGFRGAQGGVNVFSVFSLSSAGGAFAKCAALIAMLAPSVLFALTAVRYVRFLTKKCQKDSLYFCYAVYISYLAGIFLFACAAADGTMRLNGASIAGITLGAAGVIASVVLFLIARGREPRSRERTSRNTLCPLALLFLLMLFALFSTGMVTEAERAGLCALFPGELTEKGVLAVFAFLFLIAFAACAVLLAERLLGNVAQQRKPTLLRAGLAAAFAVGAALCEMYLAPAPDEMTILFFRGVPYAAILLSLLLFAAVAADTLIDYESRRPKA